MGCHSCSPKHSFRCRTIFFLILFTVDIVDLISDWLLYADVSTIREGLVYGPPEDSVIKALLAFSIIGTLTFLFECTNLWWEVFRDNPWLDVDLVSAITIWIEDLPQIAINVYIANCREDPISVFQLSKASIVLIDLTVRIVFSSVKYCNKRALAEAHQDTASSRWHVAYRVLIMLGLLLNSACAITVFVFTQTQRDLDGQIAFQVPQTLFEDQYNDQRYFQNVSVFIHLPDFDAVAPDSSSNYQASWLRLLSINDIRDRDIGYTYVDENTATHLKMALFVKYYKSGQINSGGAWTLSDCYQMDRTTRHVISVNGTACRANFFSASARSLFITFSFIPPDPIFKKLIFGDIRFNAKMYENQQCREYDSFAETISASTDPSLPTIHYYRTNASLAPNATRHLLVGQGGSPRFYRSDGKDLEDITRVWKTGWGRCQSSGSVAPHFRGSIPVQCVRNVLSIFTAG